MHKARQGVSERPELGGGFGHSGAQGVRGGGEAHLLEDDSHTCAGRGESQY